MKVFALCVVLCSMLSIKSCNAINLLNGVEGNGTVVSKEIVMNDYSEIKLSIPGDVVYEQQTGVAPYFRIETDENLMEALDIRIKGRALVIECKGGDNIRPTACRMYTNSKQLAAIHIGGSGKVQTNNSLQSEQFTIEIGGSGNAIINQLVCNKLKIDIAGSGNAELAGNAGRATFSIAGSGDIKAYNLLVQEMACEVAGSGDIEANVAQKLKGSIAGSGNIKYKGHPAVDSSIAGSGSIQGENN